MKDPTKKDIGEVEMAHLGAPLGVFTLNYFVQNSSSSSGSNNNCDNNKIYNNDNDNKKFII